VEGVGKHHGQASRIRNACQALGTGINPKSLRGKCGDIGIYRHSSRRNLQ
jgi:hypothetical protein